LILSGGQGGGTRGRWKTNRVAEIDHHRASSGPVFREQKNYCLMARILLFIICS